MKWDDTCSSRFCQKNWNDYPNNLQFISIFHVREVSQGETPHAWKANPCLLSPSHLCHGEEVLVPSRMGSSHFHPQVSR